MNDSQHEIENYRALDTRQEQTVASVLAKRVAERGDKTWVICNGQRFTYFELDQQSDRLARGLITCGVNKGDTVLLMLKDSVEIITAWLALAKLGAVEVPVNTSLKGGVLTHVINDSKASIMLMHDLFAERLRPIQDELTYLNNIVVCSTETGTRKTSMRSKSLSPMFMIRDYFELCEDSNDVLPTPPAYYDLVAVMYTSGTTGASKGVMITHTHAYEYALGVVELLELKQNDIYYNPLPLFHIAGQWAAVYACLIAGVTVVVSGKFSADTFWPDVKKYDCTCTFLLGAMANWLYRQPIHADDIQNPMERMLVVPLLPEIEDFKERYGVLVSTTWGSTEINVPTRSSFVLANSRTCGRVADDRYEVRIVDENDIELPAGMAGEAVVRAKEPWILMAGYWNNAAATQRAWRNQWVHTGDMLVKDESGNLYFVDRTKDAIRRRGENISSMEVENEINTSDHVLECAVIPVASEHTEQEVMAVIVLKPDNEIDPDKILNYLEPRMAHFMIPRYIEFVESLPKTATGKIKKYELRERGVTDATWDREHAGLK